MTGLAARRAGQAKSGSGQWIVLTILRRH